MVSEAPENAPLDPNFVELFVMLKKRVYNLNPAPFRNRYGYLS